MKAPMVTFALLLLCPLLGAARGSASVTPIGKVVQLLSDLAAKIVAEGAAAQKTYEEFSEYCEHRSKDLRFAIDTTKNEAADLEATIAKELANQGALNAKIEQLTADINTDESDLKASTWIRGKEQEDFAAENADLSEIIDAIKRAIAILQREMDKHGEFRVLKGAMLQLQNSHNLAEAFGIMVKASMLSSADASTLTALVQSSQASTAQEDDDGTGAPAAAIYKGHAGDIVTTLTDLLDKATGQLSDSRKKETMALHNFQLLKQSLEDEIKFGNNDLDEAKNALAASGGAQAVAEKGLDMAKKSIGLDTSTLADLHHLCMTTSQEFEAAVKTRDEELKALAEAKKVISSETGGAEGISYSGSSVSLLQLVNSRTALGSKIASGVDLANFEAVRFVRDLARKQSSPALAQLAMRMAAAMRSSTKGGDDPFVKVKGLITDMIARLSAEADADATEKAYCDKEISETKVKQEDKNGEIAKLSVQIDQMSARSAQLKEEVGALQKFLAELAAAQAEMDKLRAEQKAEFDKSAADMMQGLEGIKMALKILREYYSSENAKEHDAAIGAGNGIIGLLEVIESDFSKMYAELKADEDGAVAAYIQGTKANQITKTNKDQDVKYKTKEFTDLDKAVAEDSADRSGVQTELDAVLEYLRSLMKRCQYTLHSKDDSYAERKRRREAELAGLKEALEILEGEETSRDIGDAAGNQKWTAPQSWMKEAALIQQRARRTLRGVNVHH